MLGVKTNIANTANYESDTFSFAMMNRHKSELKLMLLSKIITLKLLYLVELEMQEMLIKDVNSNKQYANVYNNRL